MRLDGHVQGVGFRPFVYHLARRLGVTGWVRNRSGEVEVLACATPEVLADFERGLVEQAPALARPRLVASEPGDSVAFAEFRILPSESAAEMQVRIPPDLFTCPDCLQELFDAGDRRYRYPFINCTQCGPRYTLIRSLPYDRPSTTMAGFTLCPDCEREYRDPADRRFHAEPVACPACGPRLAFQDGAGAVVTGNEAALAGAVGALRAGRIVAVRGIGGFHLLCDAANRDSIQRLRARKPRPGKPLAVMVPAPPQSPLAALSGRVALSDAAREALLSPQRPIVVLPLLDSGWLADNLAPGLGELGVMLPYSPLHHLLLHDFGAPLVATSANVSGEPVLTELDDAQARLAHVADAWLSHDRPIARPADDPLLREIAGAMRPLRLGRGSAPLELELPITLAEPVLALGGQMKNTVTLAWDRRAVISPHIGDMGTQRSQQVFEQVAANLQALYGVTAVRLVCDAHPGYALSRWAARQPLPVDRVFHHRAHAASAVVGAAGDVPWLVFTWDGFGYGEDGSLWGGEALLGRPGDWRRVGTLRSFHIPGGERVSREAWRSAAALCWQVGRPVPLAAAADGLLEHAWRRRINTVTTSSAGRLFDAAAALTGICQASRYEGQAPMLLEAAGNDSGLSVDCPLHWRGELLEADWAPLLGMLLDERRPARERAAVFHNAMADIVTGQARALRDATGVGRVALAGGVFQNRRLSERVLDGLRRDGFETRLSQRVPLNDAGLSVGQVLEFAYRQAAVSAGCS